MHRMIQHWHVEDHFTSLQSEPNSFPLSIQLRPHWSPSTTPVVDANGPRRVPRLQRGHRLCTMDGDNVTDQVVLATEQPTR